MFTPENDLERSLVQASTDSVHRPQFYRDLMAADIFVIQHGPAGEPSQATTIPAGTTLTLQKFDVGGKPYLPFFSSLTRLRSAISEPVSFLSMNSLALFRLVSGEDLIFNPGSDYGKVFTAAEVAGMVDGTLGKPISTYVTKHSVQVLLGQPARYPQALVDALSGLFKTLPQVKRAYLVHFHNPEQGGPPHTLIAIDADGDFEELSRQIGMVVQGMKVPDPPVDCVRLTGEDSHWDYFKSIHPFYQRKKFGLF